MTEAQVSERDLPLKTRLNSTIETIKNNGSIAAIKIAGAFGVNLASRAIMNNAGFWSSGTKEALFGNIGYSLANALPDAAAVWVLADEGPSLAKGLLNAEDTLSIKGQLAEINRVSEKRGVTSETAHVLNAFQRYKDESKTNGREALTHLLTSFFQRADVGDSDTTGSALEKMGFSREQADVLQNQWTNAVGLISRHGISALAKIVAGVRIGRELTYPIFDTALNWKSLVFNSSNKDAIGSVLYNLREVFGKKDNILYPNPDERAWILPLVCAYLAARNNMPGFLRGVLEATDMKITRSLGAKIEKASLGTQINKLGEVNELSEALISEAVKSLRKEIPAKTSQAEENSQELPFERLGFDSVEALELKEKWDLAVEQITQHGSEAVQKLSLALIIGQVLESWPLSHITGYVGGEISVVAGLAWVAWGNRDLLTGIFQAIDVQKEKMQKAKEKEAAAPRERKELTALLLSIRGKTRKSLSDGIDVNSVINEVKGRLLSPPEKV